MPGISAKQLGLPPKRLLARLKGLAEQLPALAVQLREDFARREGDNQMLDRFEESIRDRAGWTLRCLARAKKASAPHILADGGARLHRWAS